jgi:membrane fusion protein (multidrug efflux system)
MTSIQFKRYNFYLLATFLFFFTSCGNKKTAQQQGPPPAVPVTVETVSYSNPVYYDEYPGTVTPLNEVQLTAQVSGYITGVYFRDGDKVRKGQKLYTIDAQVYRANYQQAVADLQVQQTNLLKAQKDAARYHELDKHDAIAKQQVDYADAALDAAKKQVAAARANVAGVQSNVKFASIYAPFSGTIGISQVKKGTAVVAGQTVLNTVSTDDPMAVDFYVDQKEIGRFMELKKTGQGLADSTFLLVLADQSVYPVPGKIYFIDRAVDPNTGTIKVRLTFQNDENLLRAGMSCKVRVKNNNATPQLVIPYKAVTEQLGELSVFIVGDSSKAQQKRVELGAKINENVIVKSGLKEGETIVTEGIQNLTDGTPVKTTISDQPEKQPVDSAVTK